MITNTPTRTKLIQAKTSQDQQSCQVNIKAVLPNKMSPVFNRKTSGIVFQICFNKKTIKRVWVGSPQYEYFDFASPLTSKPER